MEVETLKLEGTVENVIYRNENNGYTVLDIDAGGEMITAVGELGDVEAGEVLVLEGHYVNHPKFGAQFNAEYCERKLPSTSVNICKYLSSRAIKGIGPALAKKIVDAFGERTLEIMEKEPSRLLEIRGISPKKCESIAEEVKKIFNLRHLMIFLSKYGLKSGIAMKAYQQWGHQAIELIKQNPYCLCSVNVGLSFKKAEVVAKEMNIPPDSHKRIEAGFAFILSENANAGHSCLPIDVFEKLACKYLQIAESDFYDVYNEMIEEERIYEYIKNDRGFVYLDDYYTAESYIAGRIGVMQAFSSPNDYDYEKLIDIEEEQNNIHYETLQRKAITTALSRGIMVMTGGPGTGKTTTLNAIISLYEKKGETVMLSAPTGRAAKRMSDLTGREAKTIHRLLEVSYDAGGRLVFKHNEEDPLECDVLVVDEMSMVDVLVFESLLRALKLSCRLIMVGDSDQLPSVGAGNLLKSLIESKCIPVIELKEIFRQAEQSCIVTNAHKIVNGELPDLTQKNNDFFFFKRSQPEMAINLISDLVKTRLPKAYNYSALDDIQVISPSRKGVTGIIELNKVLQNQLNPSHPMKKEVKSIVYTFREGDKIMQTKNNYDIVWSKDGEQGAGIYNGDIGKILSINKQRMELVINFDGRTACYTFDMVDQLELAYAITVHKSQGSEFEAVVMPLLGGFDKLFYRNLLYTAVTRAKKLLIIIGTEEVVNKMVTNNKRTNRYTCLTSMCRDEMKQRE
ncbi:MAG: ATP-dependent RecD-like DNA helicase [Oscillospiraceae bacterium]|nr:ATP-dependent RecD-like DNA helicase [Oscillospiraceae bacterium]